MQIALELKSLRMIAMKIDVQRIPSQGMVLRYEKSASVFSTLKVLIDQHTCEFIAPVTIDLDIRLERDMVRVKGGVATMLRLTCSRCLASFESPLTNRFNLRFSHEIPQDVQVPGATDVEWTADQIGLIFYEGDEIDLKDAMAEQVILALPYKPLCNEACKGLCPRCGVDLNSARCQCPIESGTSPFAVLKNLKLT